MFSALLRSLPHAPTPLTASILENPIPLFWVASRSLLLPALVPLPIPVRPPQPCAGSWSRCGASQAGRARTGQTKQIRKVRRCGIRSSISMQCLCERESEEKLTFARNLTQPTAGHLGPGKPGHRGVGISRARRVPGRDFREDLAVRVDRSTGRAAAAACGRPQRPRAPASHLLRSRVPSPTLASSPSPDHV